MAIDSFLNDYYRSFANKGQTAPPLIQSSGNTPNFANNGIRSASAMTGSSPVRNSFAPQSSSAQTPGFATQRVLGQQQNQAAQNYNQQQQGQANQVTNQYNQMAPRMDVNSFGVLNQAPQMQSSGTTQNYSGLYSGQAWGKNALSDAYSKSAQQKMQDLQGLQANYNVTPSGSQYNPSLIPAGASPNNPGAQALASAMTAYKNGTPYVWGGNSLTGGVDCSGLVQQVYSKMGINLPRTTYEQAKSGQVVSDISKALPGDLIFYNTGSADPNGIGTFGHVGIYAGNGKMVEARGKQYGIQYSDIRNYARIVRPWS